MSPTSLPVMVIQKDPYLTMFQCSICGLRLKGDRNLAHHKQIIHEVGKKLKCPEANCGEMVFNVRKHKRQNHSHRTECPTCCKVVKNLSLHTLNVHGTEDDRKFKCQVCGKGFILNEKLLAHYAVHIEEKHYACNICNFRTKTKGNLKKHSLGKRHRAEKIYKDVLSHSMKEVEVPITYLGKARSYEERMSEFLMVSKNLEIKELSTGIEMNDHTTSNEECNEHEDTVPNQDPPQTLNEEVEYPTTPTSTKLKYVCNQCDRQFTAKKSLTRHIQSIHEGVKYACNQCDQQFTLQCNLKTHIRSIHEGVKYACNQCDQQFTLQSSLRHHLKRKHS